MRLRSEGMTWQRVGDDIVVLDLDGSSYLKVNGSGALLWERLADGADEDALVEALVERYDLDEQRAAQDVEAFVADLESRGLVERS